MKQGWISLHRSITDHWTYKNSDELKAWITILLHVNHSDTKVSLGNNLVVCKRGQSVRSLDGWAEMFGKNWNKSKVRRFFNKLKKDSMIETESITISTRLTVCNYDSYQDSRNGSDTEMKRKRNGNETQVTPNNNDNKDNNDNIKIIVDFLNSTLGTKYGTKNKKTKKLIKARLTEGNSVEDFQTVISNKAASWLSDDKMSKFLRPETLFGDKFESYLNEKLKPESIAPIHNLKKIS